MENNILRGFLLVAFSISMLSVSAQGEFKVKVKNIRSAKGKVLIATNTGQYNMVDASGDTVVLILRNVPEGKCKLYTYHDENGNYQLDKVNEVPVENCEILDLEIASDTKVVEVELKDLRDKVKK